MGCWVTNKPRCNIPAMDGPFWMISFVYPRRNKSDRCHNWNAVMSDSENRGWDRFYRCCNELHVSPLHWQLADAWRAARRAIAVRVWSIRGNLPPWRHPGSVTKDSPMVGNISRLIFLRIRNNFERSVQHSIHRMQRPLPVVLESKYRKFIRAIERMAHVPRSLVGRESIVAADPERSDRYSHTSPRRIYLNIHSSITFWWIRLTNIDIFLRYFHGRAKPTPFSSKANESNQSDF